MILNLLRPVARVNFRRLISLNSYKMQQQRQNKKWGEVPEKLKRAQKLFQEKNKLPVFLKGGNADKILYYTTLGLCGVGLFLSFSFYFSYIIDF